jgi:hypothetical protein
MTRLFKPLVATLACLLCVGAFAAESAAPVDLLREALHAESLGQARAGLAAADTDSPLVHAYLGEVRQGEDWLSLEESISRLARDSKLSEYRQRQANMRDVAAEHVAIADWCRARGLVSQERAHVLRALDFEPDNEQLRKRVGHVRGESKWLSPEEVAEQEQSRQLLQAAKDQWLPRLKQISQQLQGESESQYESAVAELAAIRDPLAVPAMEEVFAGSPDYVVQLLIKTLSRIDDARACEALVRLAVDSESQPICREAMRQLKSRDAHSFVPVLLSGLRGPISGTSTLRDNGRRGLVYSQNLRRAAQEYDEVVELQLFVARRGHTAGKGAATKEAVRQRANVEDGDLQSSVQRENKKIEDRNQRIIAVLEETTGKSHNELPAATGNGQSAYLAASGLSSAAAPQPWWNWWNSENEVATAQRTRGVVTFHRTSAVAISDRAPYGDPEPIPSSFRSSAEFQSPREQRRQECFVAGTPVWTARGQLAIEQIRTGELVLTQNVQSGQLEFKPVVRPTTRPAMALVNVTIGQDEFTCTGGHLFWVVEQGWVKARDLKPGVIVHGAQGSATVTSNEPGPTSPTFNLVMADNHNYFVGQSRLLTHDNTPRQATSLIAPGVAADEE